MGVMCTNLANELGHHLFFYRRFYCISYYNRLTLRIKRLERTIFPTHGRSRGTCRIKDTWSYHQQVEPSSDHNSPTGTLKGLVGKLSERVSTDTKNRRGVKQHKPTETLKIFIYFQVGHACGWQSRHSLPMCSCWQAPVQTTVGGSTYLRDLSGCSMFTLD